MFFEIATPTRIIFGSGAIQELIPESAVFGRRPLLVCGQTPQRCAYVSRLLEEAGHHVTVFPSEPEPTVKLVLDGVDRARNRECDFIIGIGGGSVVDTGKAISALLTNPRDPFDYLEVIGEGRPLTQSAAPYIAVPTTAGTGAEVTQNAVLSSPDHRVKVSLRSQRMLPRVAIVDPDLTHSAPPSLTASTGLDALTQVIEAYVSRKANLYTDALCREGVRRAARSLRRVFEAGDDKTAREDMALTSLFSGLALANAGLGAVHGLAGPLGGILSAPHGALCAGLLPHVMRANIVSLQGDELAHNVLSRYDELAQLLTGKSSAVARDGVDWIQDLSRDLDVEPLSALGLNQKSIAVTVEKAQHASSMKGNPADLTAEELREILYSAL